MSQSCQGMDVCLCSVSCVARLPHWANCHSTGDLLGGVYDCDGEASTMSRTLPTRGHHAMGEGGVICL